MVQSGFKSHGWLQTWIIGLKTQETEGKLCGLHGVEEDETGTFVECPPSAREDQGTADMVHHFTFLIALQHECDFYFTNGKMGSEWWDNKPRLHS